MQQASIGLFFVGNIVGLVHRARCGLFLGLFFHVVPDIVYATFEFPLQFIAGGTYLPNASSHGAEYTGRALRTEEYENDHAYDEDLWNTDIEEQQHEFRPKLRKAPTRSLEPFVKYTLDHLLFGLRFLVKSTTLGAAMKSEE